MASRNEFNRANQRAKDFGETYSEGRLRALRSQDRADRGSSQFQVNRELLARRCGRTGRCSAFSAHGSRDQSIRVWPPLSGAGCGSVRARSVRGLSGLQSVDGVQVGSDGRPVAERREAGCLQSEWKTGGQAKEDCRTVATGQHLHPPAENRANQMFASARSPVSVQFSELCGEAP